MRLLIALRMTVVLTVLTGIAYPLAITGLGALLFPAQARGSLIERDGAIVGSALIGQNFSAAGYFHGRPSAAGNGYDATASGGSNLGPTNKALIAAVSARVRSVAEKNPGTTMVPIDLVTTSGSGLDPEVSPAAADLQIARVAKARGLSEDQVRDVIRTNTRPRFAGLFGEPGVNVLQVNLALDRVSANPRPAGP
jgi:potassium-transporting ATPase KdpC subunit